MKVNTVKKAINVFVPKTSAQRFIEKPKVVSIFQEDLGKIKYSHNVLEYKPKLTTPEEVKSLFIDGRLGDNYLKDEMKRIKRKLFKSSFSDISNLKKWKHSVSLSSKLTESDLADIADFMARKSYTYAGHLVLKSKCGPQILQFLRAIYHLN